MFYSAIVTDPQDPDKRGRIKARVPSLSDDEWHDWIDVWSPAGLASVYVPRKDDLVVVVRSPGGDLRWLGGAIEGQRAWPSVFRDDYGNRHGIASADGVAAVVVRNNGGVLVLAGQNSTVTLATSADAAVEPIVLGDTLNDRIGAVEDLLGSMFSTLSTASVGPLAGLKAGFDQWATGAALLPALDLHLSRVSRTE